MSMNATPIPTKRLKQLDELLAKLGIPCGKMGLLNEALTHSSHAAENPGLADNERLEFFGDAVLKFVISEYLLERFPSYDEGRLTEIRSVLVSSNTLATLANQFDLGKYTLVGRRVSMRPSILACTMEAILGAIYLDSGLTYVQNLIVRLLGSQTTDVDRDAVKDNYKAQLQELTQAQAQGVPQYAVVTVDGPAHEPVFNVTVSVANVVLGAGSGSSKKAAEQAAARQALAKLETTNTSSAGAPIIH
ncbi:MAG: ribonuclease III [Candidatus Melainabacteria bacterium]|nr:ribonuclease III [Candidatus Melainabacteria bacterium]